MASKREAVAKAERAFRLFDKDNDGYITKEEFQKISKIREKALGPAVQQQATEYGPNHLPAPQARGSNVSMGARTCIGI